MKFNIVLAPTANTALLNTDSFKKVAAPFKDATLGNVAILEGNYGLRTDKRTIVQKEALFKDAPMQVIVQRGTGGGYLFGADGRYNEEWQEALEMSRPSARHVFSLREERDTDISAVEDSLSKRDASCKVSWHIFSEEKRKKSLQDFFSFSNKWIKHSRITFTGYTAVLRQEWLDFYATEAGAKECQAILDVVNAFFNPPKAGETDGLGSKEIAAIRQTLKDESSALIKLLTIKKHAADLREIYRANKFKDDQTLKFCIELDKVFMEVDPSIKEKDKYSLVGKHLESLENLLPQGVLLPSDCAKIKTLLNDKIQVLLDHSLEIEYVNPTKALAIRKLGRELSQMVNTFFQKDDATIRKTYQSEFQPAFLKLLNSQAKTTSELSLNLETIFKNIAVALTGVGLFIIAGQLIRTKICENRARFLFSDNKTTSERAVAEIQKSALHKM